MQYGSWAYGSVAYGGQVAPLVPFVPSATAPYSIVIAGVDQTAKWLVKPQAGAMMQLSPLQISNKMGQTATCRFTLWDPAGSYRPSVGQEVDIYTAAGSKLFGGTIDEWQEYAYQAIKGTLVTIVCTDFSGILDRRIVGDWFPGQVLTGLTTIVSGLVNKWLSADGITYDSRDGDPGISLGDQLFNWVTARQAFNQLATATGWDFNVDYSKVLRFFPKSTGLSSAPFSIADNNGNWLTETMQVRRFRGIYRNRQYIRSSTQASPLWADIFSKTQPGPYPNSKQPPGAGAIFFVTLYIITATPIVKVNGVTQRVIPLSQVAGASHSSWDWYWIPGGYGVSQNQANAPLGVNDILEVDYATKLSPVTVATCSAEVTSRATAEGNSGYYDDVQDVQNVTDPAAITAYATSLLNRYGCNNGIPLQITFKTRKDGLFAGQLITINTSSPQVPNANYLITDVQARETDLNYIEYTVTCDVGAYQGDWSQFFAQLVNRGQMPQPSNRQTYLWMIAVTQFGVANPGITSTGNWPLVHVCQSQEEVIQFFSVNTQSTAAKQIEFQLLINGSGTVLQAIYNVGDTGEKRVFNPPSQPELKIFAGDVLQIQISLNSDAAMKDVNCTLVTSVVVT